MKRLWGIWAKALGEKSGSTDSEADKVAMVRTILIASSFGFNLLGAITNICIILGIHRHWFDR